MGDIKDLRAAIRNKLGISDRQLLRLIQAKENETFFPRDLATMALAADHKVSIRRYASEQDLAQLRANSAGTQPPVPAPAATQSRAPAKKAPATRAKPARPTRGRKVFVVHGRNIRLKNDLFGFLRAIGLEPLEWTAGIRGTKRGSPSISQILDSLFEQAIAVVVLLTPDDEVRLAERFRKPSDPPHEKQLVGQARPNVLFEAGMAFGRHPESVVLVQVGQVKPFSDVGGMHVTHLDNSPQSRSELVTKLGNAGCATDTEGKSDWYETGNFEIEET